MIFCVRLSEDILSKRLSIFALALLLYPLFYTLANVLRYGSLYPLWMTWFVRIAAISLPVLLVLWVIPVSRWVRSVLYVPLIVLGTLFVHYWNNRKGLNKPEFGWSGLMELYIYILPGVLICAVCTAVVVWLYELAVPGRGESVQRRNAKVSR